MFSEHGCPALFFLTRCHVSPQNLRTLLTLSLKCLKFRCLSLGPWGYWKTAGHRPAEHFGGVKLPRLLVLWQHWQSKPQRISFVLALLRIGINFLWSGFLCWPPKHVFCWVSVVLDHFFLLKKTWVPKMIQTSWSIWADSDLLKTDEQVVASNPAMAQEADEPRCTKNWCKNCTS